MFSKQTVKDIDIKGKTVLMHGELDAPLGSDGKKVSSDFRVKCSLPTIEYLRSQDCRIVLISKLGRPDGKVNPKMSLAPVADCLNSLGVKTQFVDECIGPKVEAAVKELKPKGVLLLENLRFHPEEEANDKGFAEELAKDSGAEVFVQDCFALAHRKEAGTDAITKVLPSVAGLHLEAEVENITGAMQNPDKPLMAIVGGAKIADKLEIIKRFVELADILAVGGALANPFLVARGIDVADSLYDKAEVQVAKAIMKQAEAEAKKRGFVLILPHDVVVASKLDKTADTRIVDFSSNSFVDIEYYPKRVPAAAVKLASHEKILDVGPFSTAFIAGATQLAKTVVWNGTMGVTEVDGLQGPIGPFAHGTQTIIEALVGDLGHKPFTVVGGGDTVGYLESRQITEGFNHVSAGGGASLELMSGHKLPGVEALMDKK